MKFSDLQDPPSTAGFYQYLPWPIINTQYLPLPFSDLQGLPSTIRIYQYLPRAISNIQGLPLPFRIYRYLPKSISNTQYLPLPSSNLQSLPSTTSIFLEQEAWKNTQVDPGRPEDHFNFPLIWMNKHQNFVDCCTSPSQKRWNVNPMRTNYENNTIQDKNESTPINWLWHHCKFTRF